MMKNGVGVIPASRIGFAEDYVGPCIFLASEDSSFLTGEVLHVDGGWTLKGEVPNFSNVDFSQDRMRDKK
jgi:NAD(P)-dependent dehydrogenase (short-subunit alcohol dehydrogenase family)